MSLVMLLLPVALLQTAPAEPVRPWALTMESAEPISLPPRLRQPVLDELEYDPGDAIEGVAVDLDYDRRLDYIIRSAPSLCGNGGCSYLVLNGRSQAVIGRLFGNPLYLESRMSHGYPLISAYSHVSANAGVYTTWSFQRGEYHRASARRFEGSARDSLVAALHRIPVRRTTQNPRRGGPNGNHRDTVPAPTRGAARQQDGAPLGSHGAPLGVQGGGSGSGFRGTLD